MQARRNRPDSTSNFTDQFIVPLFITWFLAFVITIVVLSLITLRVPLPLIPGFFLWGILTGTLYIVFLVRKRLLYLWNHTYILWKVGTSTFLAIVGGVITGLGVASAERGLIVIGTIMTIIFFFLTIFTVWQISDWMREHLIDDEIALSSRSHW